jgi:hypothetical protein
MQFDWHLGSCQRCKTHISDSEYIYLPPVERCRENSVDGDTTTDPVARLTVRGTAYKQCRLANTSLGHNQHTTCDPSCNWLVLDQVHSASHRTYAFGSPCLDPMLGCRRFVAPFGTAVKTVCRPAAFEAKQQEGQAKGHLLNLL